MNPFFSLLLWILGGIFFLMLLYGIKMNLYFNKRPPFPGQKVSVGPFSLFFMEAGQEHEKTLLLVHGFQSSHYLFHKNIETLSRKMHVLALDLPGCGFSDKPLDFTYRFETFAESVKLFLDRKGISKVILAGHSMGGGVGMAFAALYPQQIDRLILIDPANPYDPESLLPFEKLTRAPIKWVLTLMDQIFLSRRIYERKICYRQKISLGEIHKITLHKWTKNHRRASRKIVMDGGIPNLLKLKELIPKIVCPVLLIYGEQDEVVDPEKGRKLAESLHYPRLVFYDHCGHSPQYEQPEKFNQTLIEWIH